MSALLGGLLPLWQGTIKTYLKKHPEKRAALETRLGKGAIEFLGGPERDTSKTLFSDLARTSSEMDLTVAAITNFTAERQATVEKLEEQLSSLSLQEEELKRRLEGLKNVPLPAAEYFAQMLEKASARARCEITACSWPA